MLVLASVVLSVVCSLAQEALQNTVGDTNRPGLLPQQVLAAFRAGLAGVTINPGTYHMPDGNGAVFGFKGWTNITISASNTLFIVGRSNAFEFINCSNVTLLGATVRPRTNPFTQGRIIRIGVDGGNNAYADWRIDTGYPTNFQWRFNAVNGDTRKIRLEVGDLYFDPNDAEHLGNQTWRLHFPGSSLNLRTNDWLVARTVEQGSAFYLRDCRNCTLQDVTSQSGWYATYREIGGGGNHMLRCRIQPAPAPPPGGTESPVVGCASDGVHTIGTYPGLHLEECLFEGVFLDDNVAIRGFFQTVVGSSARTIVFDSQSVGFEVGGPVRISSDEGFFAQATCTGLSTLPNGQIQLALDQSLQVPVGAKASNPKYNGAGYRIINCRFGNSRSRAIIVKADDGLISGCTIEDSGSAIQIGPEYSWNESDYVWNTTVTNNTIRHCRSAGVNVVGDGALGNRNLIIRNNHIDNTILGNALVVQWSDGVEVTGNTFANPGPYSPILLDHCANINLSGNFVTNGPAGNTLVEVGATARSVEGLQNGIFPAGVAYTFANRSSGLVLGNSTGGGSDPAVVQRNSDGGDEERWKLLPVGNGFAMLLNVRNGLALGVNGSTAPGTPLVFESNMGTGGQMWRLLPSADGSIALVNNLSGFAAHASSSSPGAPVIQAVVNLNATDQQWIPLSPPAGLTAAPGNQQVWLSWNGGAEAAGYALKRSIASSGPYTTIATGITTASYNDVGLANGTTYYYVFSSVQAAAVSERAAATPHAGGLPAPWRAQDLGAVGLPGSARFTNGTFYVNGSGADIWGNADAFHFVYQSMTGDGVITARVVSMQDTDPWARVGVMLRNDSSPSATLAAVVATPRNGVAIHWRDTTGWRRGFTQTFGIMAPVWVRLVRSGKDFSGYYSADGINWTRIGSRIAIPMRGTVLAGLGVTAQNNSALCEATFDQVTLPLHPPRLSATSTDRAFALSWPAAQGFSLYGAPNLIAPILWAPMTNIALYQSGTFSLTLPLAHGNHFFRLEAP